MKLQVISKLLTPVTSELESYFILPNKQIHGEYKSYTICKSIRSKKRILSEIKNFDFGVIHGECWTYYLHSKPYTKCTYTKGKLDGECIMYHKNGSPKSIAEYKNGELNDNIYFRSKKRIKLNNGERTL
jgi:antitoxin component YwqK of YwqJK toxin-antitoxin module